MGGGSCCCCCVTAVAVAVAAAAEVAEAVEALRGAMSRKVLGLITLFVVGRDVVVAVAAGLLIAQHSNDLSLFSVFSSCKKGENIGTKIYIGVPR